MKKYISTIGLIGLGLWVSIGARAEECRSLRFKEVDYSICTTNPAQDDIRLFLNDENDVPYGHFGALKDALAKSGERLSFAMNAGMYLKDRSPVGLYIENSEQEKQISTRDGPGNFHLLPNGVFWLSELGDGTLMPYVSETSKYVTDAENVAYATQSGPMLVINGGLHPKLIKGSESRKIRNGVGVRNDSGDVVFVKSEAPVNFYDFAILFKEELETENALYLDGTISRLYSKDLNRNDFGLRMGPIIGVVEPGIFEQLEGTAK